MGLVVGTGGLYISTSGGGASPVRHFDAEAEYIKRRAGGTDNIGTGKAKITMLKGKSLVWNQLVTNGDFASTASWGTYTGSTFSVSNGIASITPSARFQGISQTLTGKIVTGHKYLIKGMLYQEANAGAYINGSLLGTNINIQLGSSNLGVWKSLSGIVTAGTGSSAYIGIGTTISEGFSEIKAQKINLIDLTLLYGPGYEPTTVAEFEADYPLPYYAYNAGVPVNNCATGIKSTGWNQWDEEIEIGQISQADGQNTTGGSAMRAINYTHVFPGESYYLKAGSATDGGRVFYYAADKSYVGTDTWKPGTIKTMPSGVYFIRFQVATSIYGTTYNHDVCINLSDPAKNGTYQPYEKHTLNLNLPTLTGKLNGEGTSVTICSDGLKSAGTAYDYGVVENGYLTKIVKAVGIADLGGEDRSWVPIDAANGRYYSVIDGSKGYNDNTVCCVCPLYTYKYMSYEANDDMTMQLRTNQRLYLRNSAYTTASAFKTAMAGVPLYYELATPQTYILDNPVYVGYKVISGGTEERLPRDTASSVIAPIKYSVKYIQPKE